MPHLIGVTGSRIPLRRGHSYVIGRGLDCDVVVEDAACSRRHAQISLARTSDAAFLEDLGSRNGTFLNGTPVRSRVAMRDGSRIQIGSSIFLVRLKEDRKEIDLAETGTLGLDQVVPGRHVDGGELAAYGIIELLKLLFNARRSATVHVTLPDGHAVIEVRGGEVLSADYCGLEGFNALVKLGRQNSGIFWLNENHEPCERSIQEPCVRLIAELARCLDPAGTARAP